MFIRWLESMMGKKNAEAWVNRSAGAVSVIAFIWILAQSFSEGGSTVEVLGLALVVGFGAGMIVLAVGHLGVILVLASLDYAKGYQNPFVQGAAFAGFLAVILAVVDVILVGGQFIVEPAFYLILTGDFGDSYWGCRDHWITRDEGSYCDR